MAEQSNIGMNLLIAGVVLGLGAVVAGVTTGSKPEKFSAAVGDQAPDAISDLTTEVVEKRDALDPAKSNYTLVDVSPEAADMAEPAKPEKAAKPGKGKGKGKGKQQTAEAPAAPPVAAPSGKKVRFTPLFYSPELWQVDEGSKYTVVDIYKCEGVHKYTIAGRQETVDNDWFISNGLRDVLRYENAMQLDSDGDGFLNCEEHAKGTNPNDPASCPSIFDTDPPKLEVVETPHGSFVIQVDACYDPSPETLCVKVFRKGGIIGEKELVKKNVKKGETFGAPESPERFKVVEFRKVKYHDRLGNETEEFALVVEDQETPSNFKELVIRAGRFDPDSKETKENRKGLKITNDSAVLRVTAGSAKGEIIPKVKQGETVTIPGTGTEFKLDVIHDAGTVNIKVDGKDVTVPKAPDFKQKKGKQGKASATPGEGGEENAGEASENTTPTPAKKPAKGGKGRK